MNKKTLTLTLLLAATPGIAMSASVYKWTDENGLTHFGDRQPAGAQSEKVNVRSGTASDSASERPTPQQRLNQLEEQQQADAVSRRQAAEEEARQKQRQANCETARTNLQVISNNARIRIEENGEQRYLSQEEIAEQRQKFEEIADKNCGPKES
ncbi:DUF4124 domain-containing protein [Marinobacter sp.]|uniref:DUF4124 domain-containing protein n=1 Tax=Marinobacter sp. TaxID=50741 RepID=UPI0035C6CA09|nr:DUF4124 domain-containing protein [Oleiphilaceae bacterium]